MNPFDSQPKSIRIRPALTSDAPALALLLGELGYPAVDDQVRHRLEIHRAPNSIILVVESDERLVALLSLHLIPLMHADGFLGRVTSLVVSESNRRQGFGRLLVSAAEEYAWSNGCSRMEITSGDHRPDTHVFYEHLGYQVDCRRFIRNRPMV